MSEPSLPLELLWRRLDGEPLEASEVAALEAALSADPSLREMAELHQQTRALVHNLPATSAPATMASAIAEGIASPRPVAKVVLFGLPLQRFALVAALLIAVLGGAIFLRPDPPSHDLALISHHREAVQARYQFEAIPAEATADPNWVAVDRLVLPAGRITLVGRRECIAIDCPVAQYFGKTWNGTPLSIFVTQHSDHFDLTGIGVASVQLRHDYGVMRDEEVVLVGWKDAGQFYGLAASMPAGELVQLAESAREEIAAGQWSPSLASLRGHTIHR